MEWMKPIERADLPKGHEWMYEIKYDGFRCQLNWTEKKITLTSKNNHDISKNFPEIILWCKENQTLFKNKLPIKMDGELVILNHSYQANFPQIQTRGRMKSADRIERRAKQRPASFMVFDILEIRGDKLHEYSLSHRQQILDQTLQPVSGNKILRPVERVNSISKIQDTVFTAKSEGIIAKRKTSTYQKGKRHADWYKVKNWRVIQGILTEYNPANGYFTVNVLDGNRLISLGKCKHGLTKEEEVTIIKLFKEQGRRVNGIYHLPPAITCRLNTLDLYNGELREPNFHRITPDIPHTACTFDQLELDMTQLPIEVSNTVKYLWPGLYKKKDLLVYIREISSWMLPFLKERALTVIRCPDGIDKQTFFQKNLPDYAPDYLSAEANEDIMVCNHLESLVWLANHGSIEYHIPFQKTEQVTPLEIAFDLDPPDRKHFNLAVKAAKLLKQIVDDLNLVSFVKTSGNKGIQVHIPIREGSMTYEETGVFTEAVAKTLERAYPNDFTTERLKKKRNGRLYIDYVQHGKDKTLIAPYSPRVTNEGTVSTPLYWHEVDIDLDPTAFTIENTVKRVKELGCPFEDYLLVGARQNLSKILKMVRD